MLEREAALATERLVRGPALGLGLVLEDSALLEEPVGPRVSTGWGGPIGAFDEGNGDVDERVQKSHGSPDG